MQLTMIESFRMSFYFRNWSKEHMNHALANCVEAILGMLSYFCVVNFVCSSLYCSIDTQIVLKTKFEETYTMPSLYLVALCALCHNLFCTLVVPFPSRIYDFNVILSCLQSENASTETSRPCINRSLI